jgi:hypothetical protein
MSVFLLAAGLSPIMTSDNSGRGGGPAVSEQQKGMHHQATYFPGFDRTPPVQGNKKIWADVELKVMICRTSDAVILNRRACRSYVIPQ